jgi:uncharacterized protein
MRRSEREITDKQEIFDVLRRCDTLRIAVQDSDAPYIVPVSFGMEVIDDQAVVYFHCAQAGRKLDLMRAHPRVCVEGDIYLGVEKTAHGITTRYESIIATGECHFLSESEDILHGLKLLTEHYGYSGYPLERCAGLAHLLVGRIILEEISGKRNLPLSSTPADRMR